MSEDSEDERAGRLERLIVDLARGYEMTEAEAAGHLKRALEEPVVEPLKRTGPHE